MASADQRVSNSEPDCVALKDTDLVYLACSTAYARAFGFGSPEELIGKTDIDLLDRDSALESLKIEADIVLNGKAGVTTSSHPAFDNRIVEREPVLAAGQQVSGIDIRILERPGAEAVSERYSDGLFHDHLASAAEDVSVVRKPLDTDFRQLLESLPHGLLLFRGVRLVYANREAASILGYKSSADILRTGVVSNLFRLDDWLSLSGGLQLPVARSMSETPPLIEMQGVSGDKRSLVLHAWGREIKWLNERATMLCFVDSTENALSEQLLVESEQRFKHYAEASADFFWEMDADLRFVYFSDSIETALGVSTADLVGRSSQDLADNSETVQEDGWTEQLDRLLHHQRFADFEFKWKHSDGRIRVIRYSGVPVFNDKGEFTGYRGSGRDITGSHQRVEAVAYHASHDSLTGLVNRRKFEESARLAINSARSEQETHALCFLDLDKFKFVNDSCGHEAGDELLRQLSDLMQKHVRKSDVLARIGGDEFAVLLYNCGMAEALRLANQLRSEVENFQFLWKDNRFSIGISAGVVLVDKRWENTGSLFRAADMACYLAKDSGRNRVVVYQDNEVQKSVRQGETHWADQINAALEENRLKIACQKILPLKKNGRAYFEILMRLGTGSGAFINPQAFLPAAERYGLSTKLDETVVDTSLAWLKDNPRIFDELGMCSINLSSPSFSNELFTTTLLKKIKASGLPPKRLCFELSETATIANLSSATRFIHHLGDLGCRVAVDNFGSGLSSFAYIRHLPVDFVKIDGLFVRDILEDNTDLATVKAINDIARTLGKKTVATFVENGRLLSRVRDLDVDFAQGFHIGQPEIINP